MRTIFKRFAVLFFVIPVLFFGGGNVSANDGVGRLLGAIIGHSVEHALNGNHGTYMNQPVYGAMNSHHMPRSYQLYNTRGHHGGHFAVPRLQCRKVLVPQRRIISGRAHYFYSSRITCSNPYAHQGMMH